MSQEKTWKEISLAAVTSKSSTNFLTGDWKTYMPNLTRDKCTKCLTCTILCPEGAIHPNPKTGQIEFNLNYCKGCGICANECPVKAINMKIPEEGE